MMYNDDYALKREEDGTLTVVMGRDRRPPSPEPPSSPCAGQHRITPLGMKEGWQNSERKIVVVRAVHNCSKLNAAVIMNDEASARTVLKSELSTEELNRFDCSGSPALCEAAYHNRHNIAKLLLYHPTIDVDVRNSLGLTPLCIAAGNALDFPKMTEMLLSRKAQVNVRAKDGRSPLHIAAEGGRYRIVCRLMNTKSISEDILISTYRDGGIFCPPPIILAAANGHGNIVDYLLAYFPHTPSIVKDARLLLWSRHVLDFAMSGRYSFNDQDALAALQINIEAESHHSPPVTAYGNLHEMSTVQELEAFSSLPGAEGICGRVFQALIILERNLGLSNKLVGQCCYMAIAVFKTFNKHEIVFRLLVRIFEGMFLMERSILNLGLSMMPSHLHVTLSLFLAGQFWKQIRELTEARYNINFVPFINGLVNALDTILSLKELQPCQRAEHWGESFQTDFTHLVALIACALLSAKTRIRPSNEPSLDEIGLNIVSKYDRYASENFTSLVHLVLRRAKGITEILKCSGIGAKNALLSYSLLIEALVHWGCSKYLNMPYKQFFCKGELPLHMSVRLAEMDPCYLQVVNILLCHGAHYDGVADSGICPSKIATRDQLKACFDINPLPLACLTSKAIINNRLPYREMSCLPPVVKRFIAYHDSS